MSSRRVERSLSVLAIGAHPDDIEYGAGGSIAQHVAAGHNVTFLMMTLGEQGGASGTARKKEAQNSAKVLGVRSVRFGGFKDTAVDVGIQSISVIAEVVRAIQPFRMYIPFPRDPHQDHRNTALASISASRGAAQVLAYESPQGVSDFKPEYFVPIGDAIGTKLKALKCFRSQRQKDYLKRSAIEGLARFRGFQVRTDYAEAFEIIRFVELLGERRTSARN